MRRNALMAGLSMAAGMALFANSACAAPPIESAGHTTPPDFSGFWTRAGDNPSTFEPAPSGPSAIVAAIAHHGHCVVPENVTEPGFTCAADGDGDTASNAWVADYTNPILQPQTRAALKKNADGEAAGISHMSFQQNCKPSGVPQVLNLRYTVQLLQTPSQLTILYENNQQVRRADINGKHPAHVQPSWYGHSVAHYEGDTLVIDTVGQNATTEIDRFGTLHSDRLHVVERYRMLGRDKMQVIFTVDDPKAFTMPWRGVATYKRVDISSFPEFVCAENNRPTNLHQTFDVPTATKADF